jgi:hypothetical protein
VRTSLRSCLCVRKRWRALVHAGSACSYGTGKTMAANVIDNHLGLDLHRINLSAVVRKYIGETRENLVSSSVPSIDAIIFSAKSMRCSVTGWRCVTPASGTRTSQISCLPQRMEAYD